MNASERFNEELSTIEDSDPIDAYRQSLSDLVLNSKPHIVMLTMLAEELKDNRAADIVNCIEERLYQVKNEAKLPTLYLIDSICKNIRNSSYSQLFQKRIVNLFCHTFSRSDEKTRELLFKLRQTWKDYFIQDVLYNLDLAVKQIDPGWPIVAKIQQKQPNNNSTNNSNNSNNNSINQQQSTNKEKPAIKSQFGTIKLNEPDSGTTEKKTGTAHPTIIILKQNDLEQKRKNVETELRQMIIKNNSISLQQSANKSMNTSKPNTAIKLNKIEQPPSINNNNNNNNKRIKTNQSTKIANSSKKENKFLNEKKILTPMDIILPKKIKTKIPKRKTLTSPSVESNHPNKIAKKNQEETVVPIVAPADVIPLGRDYHVAVSKRTKEARIRNENIAAIKNIKNRRSTNDSGRRKSPTLQTGRKCLSPTNAPKSPIDSKQKQTTMHTTIPAPNVFTQPEVLYSFNNNENNSKHPQTSSNFVMDRDYRHEIEAIMNDAQKKLNAGTISSADHDILVREAERQFFGLQNRQQPCQTAPNQQNLLSMPANPQTLPPPAQPYPPINPHPDFNQMLPSNNYGLEPPNGSAPIYINKQFCRVFYLDHITGIVLFKMHPDTPFEHLVSLDPVYLEPKQVYFSGHPTNVIMDPGLPTEQIFCLNFNSHSPYIFSLNGIPQRIMLGLPDRELIVNDRPYKAQFGGQPISVYMESDNQNHMFLLSDSRPFLQVSEQPRYDLWNRLVSEAKAKLNAISTSANVGYGFESSAINTTMTIPAAPSTTFVNTNLQQPIYPATTTVNDPTFQSKESFTANPLQFTETKPISDLNSLLSKLTAVGLINNPATSLNANNKESEPKILPVKKYLSLDMTELKKDHQFVIDQLYMGIQCTNCSLRFPDESLQDHLGKKSRYANHLDWHFRQNRREKTKPEFGSTVVAHRRSWYYTIDQWIQFKEVNDDVEDENHSFFDLNLPNSPNESNKTAIFNMNFSVYKDSISDFDLFIETISCDNNKPNMESEKICSVLADSDVTSNCTVCNEPFDIRWFEEEEEWRLMNAVCYTNDDDECSQNFHPLCLKDHLLQINSQIKNQTSNFIPRLDTPLKEEESLYKIKPDDDNDDAIDDDGETEFKEKLFNDQPDNDGNNDENNEVDIKQELTEDNFEVKVEEFEIPITCLSEQSVKEEDNIESMADSNSPEQQQPQLKRGIVLKLKKLSSNESDQESKIWFNHDHGDYLKDTEMKKTNESSNNDDNKQSNDSNNKELNIENIENDGNGISTNKLDSGNIANNNNITDNFYDTDESKTNLSDHQENVEESNNKIINDNLDDNGCVNKSVEKDDEHSLETESKIEFDAKPQNDINYYSRGHETSSLCTIM